MHTVLTKWQVNATAFTTKCRPVTEHSHQPSSTTAMLVNSWLWVHQNRRWRQTVTRVKKVFCQHQCDCLAKWRSNGQSNRFHTITMTKNQLAEGKTPANKRHHPTLKGGSVCVSFTCDSQVMSLEFSKVDPRRQNSSHWFTTTDTCSVQWVKRSGKVHDSESIWVHGNRSCHCR